MSTISLLVGHSRDLAWGVAAGRVRAVLDSDDPAVEEGAPLDADALLGVAPLAGAQRRVLLLHTASGAIALSVTGRLEVRAFEESQVLSLPPQFIGAGGPGRQGQGSQAALCGVVFDGGRAPLLIFDADRLGAVGGEPGGKGG